MIGRLSKRSLTLSARCVLSRGLKTSSPRGFTSRSAFAVITVPADDPKAMTLPGMVRILPLVRDHRPDVRRVVHHNPEFTGGHADHLAVVPDDRRLVLRVDIH